jgi:ankyrin repeat protein
LAVRLSGIAQGIERCDYASFLLEEVGRGADPSVKRNDGGTALYAAADSGNTEIYRYLVEDCGLDILKREPKLMLGNNL